ncbi:hypothetical protein V8F33_009244 [Rhypophila sp. PSN 637]
MSMSCQSSNKDLAVEAVIRITYAKVISTSLQKLEKGNRSVISPDGRQMPPVALLHITHVRPKLTLGSCLNTPEVTSSDTRRLLLPRQSSATNRDMPGQRVGSLPFCHLRSSSVDLRGAPWLCSVVIPPFLFALAMSLLHGNMACTTLPPSVSHKLHEQQASLKYTAQWSASIRPERPLHHSYLSHPSPPPQNRDIKQTPRSLTRHLPRPVYPEIVSD